MKVKTCIINWSERLSVIYTDLLQGSFKYGNPLAQLKHDSLYKKELSIHPTVFCNICASMDILLYLKLDHNPSERLILQACIKALSISCENILTWISSMPVYVQKCVTTKSIRNPRGLWINVSVGSSNLHGQGVAHSNLPDLCI